ncbi:flagellar hook-length control protein FliK [Alisedimentitalea sp. MJ-SS2]|uniref:flagellar hook-length control protein FliK n=1 Tax=Aliisedimentitalea sp. MJ-SS2 TaxID=3049795 RepID=UPI00290C7C50|nr:flagellar hook-length control protein FliK [Alisedimentitalea sp. MJ-SS2]MDU8929619.1 flagellar hook-length control protein FliK [Alisedimentitalea sp. MJ-SS2]
MGLSLFCADTGKDSLTKFREIEATGRTPEAEMETAPPLFSLDRTITPVSGLADGANWPTAASHDTAEASLVDASRGGTFSHQAFSRVFDLLATRPATGSDGQINMATAQDMRSNPLAFAEFLAALPPDIANALSDANADASALSEIMTRLIYGSQSDGTDVMPSTSELPQRAPTTTPTAGPLHDWAGAFSTIPTAPVDIGAADEDTIHAQTRTDADISIDRFVTDHTAIRTVPETVVDGRPHHATANDVTPAFTPVEMATGVTNVPSPPSVPSNDSGPDAGFSVFALFSGPTTPPRGDGTTTEAVDNRTQTRIEHAPPSPTPSNDGRSARPGPNNPVSPPLTSGGRALTLMFSEAPASTAHVTKSGAPNSPNPFPNTHQTAAPRSSANLDLEVSKTNVPAPSPPTGSRPNTAFPLMPDLHHSPGMRAKPDRQRLAPAATVVAPGHNFEPVPPSFDDPSLPVVPRSTPIRSGLQSTALPGPPSPHQVTPTFTVATMGTPVQILMPGLNEQPGRDHVAAIPKTALSPELAATEAVHSVGPTLFSPATPAKAPLAVQIAQQIVTAIPHPNGQPIELRLNPEELGRVNLSLLQSDTAITVTILAERGETLDLLRRHIALLEREFRDIGFEKIQFTFGSSDHSNTNPEAEHGDDHPGNPTTVDAETDEGLDHTTLSVSEGLDLRL